MYLTDWYDTGECHENDADNAHRENGRIYKISFGTAPVVKVDLAGESDLALARSDFIPMIGMCARPDGCCRNARRPGKTWARQIVR